MRARKSPAYKKRIGERFGRYPKAELKDQVIWFHTVSVGEFIAAKPLIQHYIDQASTSVLVTTMTPTGSDRVSATFGDQVLHCYLPYDIPFFVGSFLSTYQPNKFICLETELWPNLIHECSVRNIPVILANGRLSEKSAKGYQKVSALTRPMLKSISIAAIQNRQDADRFIELGLPASHCETIGSIKFDLELSEELENRARELKSTISKNSSYPVWIAASTHKGEDEIVLNAFRRVKESHPDLKLIIVPRHPERFDRVYALASASGFEVKRRSEYQYSATHSTASPSEPEDISFDILVGDTMGELMLLFGVSDIAFIGGSLVSNGGHNYIEPAAWSLPILTGPSTYNFREIAKQLDDCGALTIVNSDGALATAVTKLMDNLETASKRGAAGKRVAEKNRGAMRKLISIIDSV